MRMGIDDKIVNGNTEWEWEWETTCMEMGMAIIPMGINSHRQIPCLAYVLAKKKDTVFHQSQIQFSIYLFSVVCDVQ